MRFPPVARFMAACGLFAGWMGYLAFLAATSSKPVILLRPQLLISEVDVIADVNDLDGPVTVREILHAGVKDASLVEGAELPVENLRQCQRQGKAGEAPDEITRGRYLLPLRTTPNGRAYVVAEVPPLPGSPPGSREPLKRIIYPATDEVLYQYRVFRGDE